MLSLKQITILLSDWVDYFVIFVTFVSLLSFQINRYFKVIFWYCLTLSLLYLTSSILAKQNVNNWPTFHIIGCTELCFSFIIYKELGLKKIWTYLFIIVLLFYSLDSAFVIYNGFTQIGIDPDKSAYFANNLGLSVSLLFIIVLGINFLWQLYLNEETKHINRYPYFYISAGLTVFASSAFLLYLFSTNLLEDTASPAGFFYLWTLVIIFTYVKFSLIALGILLSKYGNRF